MTDHHDPKGRYRPRGRLGVAIGRNELLAAWFTDGAVRHRPEWQRPIAARAEDLGGGRWPALTEAIASLSRELGGKGQTIDVALLPPLVQLRRIEIPRLRPRELHSVLVRDAASWFIGVREPQVVATRRLSASRQGQIGLLAAVAPAALVEAVYAAAAEAGWRVESIVPAYEAWAAATTKLWPASGANDGHMALLFDDRSEVLHVERGRPVGVRRLLPNADAGQLREAVGRPAGTSDDDAGAPLALVGPPDLRKLVADRISASNDDSDLVLLPELSEGAVSSPAVLAAAFAHRGSAMELVPASVASARHGASRRATMIFSVATALIVVAAAALEWLGVRRELDAVTEQRRSLARQVGAAMASRHEIASLTARLDTLGEADRRAIRWSAAVVTLAEHLPADAYLVAMRGTADSVLLDGVAQRAAGVIEAVQDAAGIAGVHSVAAVRSQQQEDGRSVERFSLAVRLLTHASETGKRP